MDEVDAKILRLLQWNPLNPVDNGHAPYGIWDVARELGIHGNSVKRRLQTMVDDGVVSGFTLFPEAGITGLRASFVAFAFDDDQDCDLAADAVFGRCPPGSSMRTSDREIRYNIVVPSGASIDDEARRFCEESGATGYHLITSRNWPIDELTDLERRVLNQMHRNVMASPPDIANAVGVTPKTVRRCVRGLRDKRAFCLCALVDYTKVSGLVTAIIEVEAEDDVAVREAVLRAFPDLLSEGTWTARRHTFSVFAKNQEEIGHIMAEMRTIRGVRQARLVVPLRMQFRALPSGLEDLVNSLASAQLATVAS